MTQAGRKGYPIQRVTSEVDLNPIREQFTELAWRIRERTGCLLELAHNCTVTRKNINHVPDIIHWMLADPKRTQIWRMLSFQPQDVWNKLCEGTGLHLRRDVTILGHPDCNSWASLLVSRSTGEIAPLLPDDPKWDKLLSNILSRISGLSLANDDAGTPPYRLAGLLLRNIGLFTRVVGRGIAMLFARKLPTSILRDLLRGQVHTFGLGIHNFMDAAEVARAEQDPTIKCRLDSCVFKGAVKRNGEWEAVPMCSMNHQVWSDIYQERAQRPELRKLSQATRLAETAAGKE